MKRSAALARLSRDHQHALDAALRLRRAEARSVADAVAHFAAFFEGEGRRHFEIEERVLLSALPADNPEWAEAVHRIRQDHDAIRTAAATAGDLSFFDAQALGRRLTEHVRFEERVAFAILERDLSSDELDRLGRAVEAAGGASAS
jgi:hemerythrin-like domain-containing protein